MLRCVGTLHISFKNSVLFPTVAKACPAPADKSPSTWISVMTIHSLNFEWSLSLKVKAPSSA